MKTNTFTVKQLAGALGVDYVDARGFIRTLDKLGQAKQIRAVKTGSKGKPSEVFEAADSITLTIPELVAPQDAPKKVEAPKETAKTETAVAPAETAAVQVVTPEVVAEVPATAIPVTAENTQPTA